MLGVWYTRKGSEMLAGNRMTHNPITISSDVSIAEAMERMKREKVRRFPVVDKSQLTTGNE